MSDDKLTLVSEKRLRELLQAEAELALARDVCEGVAEHADVHMSEDLLMRHNRWLEFCGGRPTS